MKKKINKKLFRSKEIDVTDGFKQTLELMEYTDKNMYITGKAGTGKSTLLKHFVKNTNKELVVLAPTGVSAINIGGTTIHSFFQFPFGIIEEGDIEKLHGKAELFEKLQVLVIDEISMVRSDMMHAIDRALQKNTGRYGVPFGGVQIIMFGDLYQLPPVVTKGDEEEYLEKTFGGKYFFHCKAFAQTGLTRIELSRNFRQMHDRPFLSLLNNVREKTLRHADLALLNQRIGEYADKKNPAITLATTNRIVDGINEEQLDKLRGKEYVYKAYVKSGFDRSKAPADVELRLKKGAQIMMIKNDTQTPRRWVNGTLGKVVSLKDNAITVKIDGKKYKLEKASWEDYEYEFDAEADRIEKFPTGSFTQYPVRLAWAVTIHKSQGKTFDRVVIDLGRGAFAHGQTYVALSRCTSLEGIYLKKSVRYSDIILDEEVRRFHGRI